MYHYKFGHITIGRKICKTTCTTNITILDLGKYVKKNSEDRSKAKRKRVLIDEAWMLLPYPEAVDFLNTMARRARKRNVSLAVMSQKFQDFYEKPEVQAVLTSSDTKLF